MTTRWPIVSRASAEAWWLRQDFLRGLPVPFWSDDGINGRVVISQAHERTSQRACVYIAVHEPYLGRFKIGVSSSPKRRRAQLNSGGFPVVMVSETWCANRDRALWLESALHRRFGAIRAHGNEWFAAPHAFVVGLADALTKADDRGADWRRAARAVMRLGSP